jgi:hypothetical protein
MLLVAQAVIETANHRHGTEHPPKIIKIKNPLIFKQFSIFRQVTTGFFICVLHIIIILFLQFDLCHSLFELFDVI